MTQFTNARKARLTKEAAGDARLHDAAPELFAVLTDMEAAYRILREAYHRDMHREEPPANDLQIKARDILAKVRGETPC